MTSGTATNDPTQASPATVHAFVRRRRGASLARCFARLVAADGVGRCDRVTGGWDLVLRLHAADGGALERLARAHLETFDVEAYELHFGMPLSTGEEPGAAAGHFERTRGPGEAAGTGGDAGPPACAYAVARLDAAAPAAVRVLLGLDAAVAACDLTHGGGEAVLLLRALDRAGLERALSRVRAERGVAALRVLHVLGPPAPIADRPEARTRAAP